ncbi:LLM class F420-dependent oxidoreductase [Bailinhaonella thermotolerans]|uniref:LLM class F420-dependent oxidoreductase n=1 Tax=Bailinhaonella thermotolerans TaxID=1070861 RepID=A0A3A4AUW3_9ACTN|nr:LLM class F420-dependent oxidoreductase [Bailinhaonella thermotolerans]RJL32065.1 LLM class F420-dependent oxidoreductase [Bailinhaonella thermotolerans]
MGVRWGLTIPLNDLSLPEHRELVRELPELGYSDVWSAEVNGADGFVPLALAAEWAPGMRLGSAVVPVYTRGPALLAQSAATLAELAPGRFVLGIGSSSPAIVERWNGGEFAKPYQRTRDTLRFLRRALSGEKVSEEYETFTVKGFRLERPPAEPPRIVLAALRPGMLRLAAAEADGAITNWVAPEDVPKVRAEVGPDTELIARVFVCVNPDAGEARRLGRWLIASYLTVPAYRAFHDWLGRGDALAPMHEAWAAGDRAGAMAAIPDEVVDALIVHGDADACRARLQAYADNGLDTPVVAVLPGSAPGSEVVRRLVPKSG